MINRRRSVIDYNKMKDSDIKERIIREAKEAEEQTKDEFSRSDFFFIFHYDATLEKGKTIRVELADKIEQNEIISIVYGKKVLMIATKARLFYGYINFQEADEDVFHKVTMSSYSPNGVEFGEEEKKADEEEGF